MARALNLNAANKKDRAKISALLRMWLESGALAVEERADKSRRVRKFVVVGQWVSLEEETFS